MMAACGQKNQSYGTITGTIKNIKNDTTFCLVDYDSNIVIQKFIVRNGHFKIKYSSPTPKPFIIRPENFTYQKDLLLLWLDNSPTELYGNMYNIADSKIEGSAPNKIYDIYKSIEYNYQHDLTKIKINKYTTDKKVLDSLAIASKNLQIDYKNKLLKFYVDNINSEVAIYNILFETVRYLSVLDKTDIKYLYELLPEKFKTSKDGIAIKTYISLPEVPKIGDKFIDFSQSTPDGKLETISNNLGKYTILEFWSSSCGACRIEHPRLRKLYYKYHQEGLNIIGISSDEKMTDWVQAIKKDTIPWLNISDLKGSYNHGFRLHGVRGVPRLFLLDKDGIILDNNFGFNYYIEDKLKELFEI